MTPTQVMVYKMCRVVGSDVATRTLAGMDRKPRRTLLWLSLRSSIAIYLHPGHVWWDKNL